RLAKDLAAAEEKFEKAFARAVAKGDCLSQATAAEAYAVIAQAGARLLGKLSPSCGDGILASSEACDGSETGTCAGDCLPDCTCAGACGDGIVQAGEACDGSGC